PEPWSSSSSITLMCESVTPLWRSAMTTASASDSSNKPITVLSMTMILLSRYRGTDRKIRATDEEGPSELHASIMGVGIVAARQFVAVAGLRASTPREISRKTSIDDDVTFARGAAPALEARARKLDARSADRRRLPPRCFRAQLMARRRASTGFGAFIDSTVLWHIRCVSDQRGRHRTGSGRALRAPPWRRFDSDRGLWDRRQRARRARGLIFRCRRTRRRDRAPPSLHRARSGQIPRIPRRGGCRASASGPSQPQG